MCPSSDTSTEPQTLVIHIGDHKTGSTSIQSAFTNGVTLDGKQVFLSGKMGHHGLAASLKAYERSIEKSRDFDKHWKAACSFAPPFKKSKARYKLITAEGFEGVSPQTVQAFADKELKGAASGVQIIAYVRPHASRILSSFAEQVKLGQFTGTLEEFADLVEERGRFFYMERFSAWREIFGDRFVLRPFTPKEWINQSLLEDFCHYAFNPASITYAAESTSNSKLYLEDLACLKLLQSYQQNKAGKMRHALGWFFAHKVSQLPVPEKRTSLALHQGLVETIQATYHEDACALDQSFFDGKPLMQDALESASKSAIAEPQSLDPADHFDAETLRGLNIMAELATSILSTPNIDWTAHMRQTRRSQIGLK